MYSGSACDCSHLEQQWVLSLWYKKKSSSIHNSVLAVVVHAIRLRHDVMDRKNQSVSKLAESSIIMTITFMIVTLSVNALVTGLIG